MIELDKQLHKFTPEFFGTIKDFLATADSTQRDTLMLACADHGTAPDHVSFARAGRFSILQHIGASVRSAHDPTGSSVIDDVELLLDRHDHKHVVVCGHLACRVIRDWMKPDMPDYGGLTTHFRTTTQAAVDAAYPSLQDEERIERMICEHVLFQVENLQTHDCVRERLEAGRLRLHAWIANDITARIYTYDPVKSTFTLV